MFLICGFLSKYILYKTDVALCEFKTCFSVFFDMGANKSARRKNDTLFQMESNNGGKTNLKISHVINSKINISWNAVFIQQGGSIVYSAGFPEGIFKALQTDSEEQNKTISSIAQSFNSVSYLSRDGYCRAKIKDNSAWVNIKIAESDDRINLIDCGENHICGIADSKQAYIVDVKEVTTMDVPVFKSVCPKIKIKEISCGKEHILLLTNIGTVFSHGAGSRGQLGHGTIEDTHEPCMIEALQAVTVTSVAAGGWHSAVVSDIGDLYCWGWNETGQLGLPSPNIQEQCSTKSGTSESPAQQAGYVNIATLPQIVDLLLCSEDILVTGVSCGSRHTAAITDTGELYTWGWNEYGQLGLGDTESRDIPTCVSSLAQQGFVAKQVHCGGWTTVIEANSSSSVD